MKLFISALLSSALLAGGALAEPVSSPPAETGRSAAPLRQNNITSTGATVPHPGASQGAGPTPLDRDIEHMNDRIENSICKGC
jgi:hypothetical protein